MTKILVIDDEKPTLKMFALFLEVYGYEMLPAESGEQGLEVFKEERPSLVLTDIKMPGMDGIEVLKRIKEIDPTTEVIVITGHGDMDLAIEALNLDAADFINKPIQRSALEQALKRAKERLEVSQTKKEEISVTTYEDAAVIKLQGSVTSSSELFLLEAYKKAIGLGKKKLILSFNDNVSINGAGIAILTQILMDSRQEQIRICASGLSENFRKVFKIVGLTKAFTIYDTLEEASKKC